MPKKLPFIFNIFFAYGIVISSSSAQDLESGDNISKHTIGFGIGYTYPKFANGSKSGMVESDFNFGLSGAFEWGKYYDSGISLMISPIVYYSNYNGSIDRYELYHYKDNKLIYRTEKTVQFEEWALCLPVSYEFPFFNKFRLGVGASMALPFITSGSVKRQEYDYYLSGGSQGGHYINPILREEYEYDIEYRLQPEFGVIGKFLYQIRSNESVESYLSLEYWYCITYTEPSAGHKTRFALTYSHRFKQLKEVREKWDRYWIRKSKIKG